MMMRALADAAASVYPPRIVRTVVLKLLNYGSVQCTVCLLLSYCLLPSATAYRPVKVASSRFGN